jgi:hypothetical protein
MPRYCFERPNRKEVRHFKSCDVARIARFAASNPNYGRTHVLACTAKGLGFTHVCLSPEEYAIARGYVVGGYVDKTVTKGQDAWDAFLRQLDAVLSDQTILYDFVNSEGIFLPELLSTEIDPSASSSLADAGAAFVRDMPKPPVDAPSSSGTGIGLNKVAAILAALAALATLLRKLIPPAETRTNTSTRRCYPVDEVIVAQYCACRASTITVVEGVVEEYLTPQ